MSDAPADTPSAAGVGVTPGEIVAGRALRMTLARVLAFSGGSLDEPGWPQRNLHTDLAKAREAGLDHIIASGTQSEGLLLGLMVSVFGPAWRRGGRLDVRFVKPVSVGDTVRPMLQWVSSEVVAGGRRYEAACWCENEAGERVVDGTASCTVSADEEAASPLLAQSAGAGAAQVTNDTAADAVDRTSAGSSPRE